MANSTKRKRESAGSAQDEIETGELPQTSTQEEDTAPSNSPKKQQQSRSLFIRSLPSTTTTETLISHFSASYPIKHGHAVIDPSTQTCKGYGFIAFADAEDAQRALTELNGSKLLGRKIKLEIAEPRKRELDDTLPGELRQRSQPSAAAVEAKARRQRELESRKKDAVPPKLIVRNLPWSVKEPGQLAELFLPFGKVKYAVVPKKGSGEMAGFGFVTMRGRKNAESAMAGVNGKEIDGRALAVDWAVEKSVWEDQAGKRVDKDMLPDRDEFRTNVDDAVALGSDEADEANEGISIGASDEDIADGDGEDDDDEEFGNDEDAQKHVADDKSPAATDDRASTVFVRNLPFTTTDDILFQHFRQFGPIRYARTVLDPATERPRGTAFVCFRSSEDAKTCIVSAPKSTSGPTQPGQASSTLTPKSRSVLQSEEADPTGKYTIDGRILQLSRAVDKTEATRLAEEGNKQREKDKRRFYLLSEGTLSPSNPLYQQLSPSEIAMRDASASQRKKLFQSNPSLHVSLTRLSIRNIPRSVTSRDLKALARQAVVGFATDVKEGKREKLSKEELARNGEEMAAAEKDRKRRGVGIVKQAKVVFEGQEGGKVEEKSGGGRSRGYGFIEYYSHRSALMGLRWLNGYAVGYQIKEPPKGKRSPEEIADKKKRLIVEFAIENAQVVGRRNENERKSRDMGQTNPNVVPVGVRNDVVATSGDSSKSNNKVAGSNNKKTVGKRDEAGSQSTTCQDMSSPAKKKLKHTTSEEDGVKPTQKLAKRQKILFKKRTARKEKRKGLKT